MLEAKLQRVSFFSSLPIPSSLYSVTTEPNLGLCCNAALGPTKWKVKERVGERGRREGEGQTEGVGRALKIAVKTRPSLGVLLGGQLREPGWEKQAETRVRRSRSLAHVGADPSLFTATPISVGSAAEQGSRRESSISSDALACFLSTYCVPVSGK